MLSQRQDTSPGRNFLHCWAGKAWLLMLVLILVTSIAGGYALYRSNVSWFETNKSDETTTALRLVEAMVANYTDVRSSILGENAPVPAEFRDPRLAQVQAGE